MSSADPAVTRNAEKTRASVPIGCDEAVGFVTLVGVPTVAEPIERVPLIVSDAPVIGSAPVTAVVELTAITETEAT